MPARRNGFALLIVLWSLVLIGLLAMQIVASGRNAMLLAGNLRAAAQAQAVADGAVNEAIFHLLSNGVDHWPADGTVHDLVDGGIPIAVRVDSLAGKINPNLASAGLLAGLFEAVGAGSGQARQIAGSIIDWRSPAASRQQNQARLDMYRRLALPYGPPGHDFADLGELSYVAHMPPALLAAALPFMSLFPSGDPDPAIADPTVRRALALSGQTGTNGKVSSATSTVVRIQAVAGIKGKLAVHREAYVSLTGQNGSGTFHVLAGD